MSLTFEELADAGLAPQPTHSPSKRRLLYFSFLLLCSCGAAYAAWSFFGEPAEQLPEAAMRLVVETGAVADADVLPHTMDDATEFEAALHTLKPGVVTPQLRETEGTRETLGLVGQANPETQGSHNAPVAETPATPLSLVQVEALPANTVVELEIERRWTGHVLVPDGVQLSRAFTSHVSMSRVEAHPLDDGRLRVWIRLKNLSGRDLTASVGCDFSSRAEAGKVRESERVTIPKDSVIDAHFLSPVSEVVAYTILVKRVAQ